MVAMGIGMVMTRHDAPKQFIYSSRNLNVIYIIQWLLVTYTFVFLVLNGIQSIGVAAVIPTGLLITAASIGLSVIWKRVRQGSARQ